MADYTTNLIARYDLQDDSADPVAGLVIDAAVGSDGALVANGGQTTHDLTGTGPGGTLLKAISMDGTNDYITHPDVTYNANTAGSIMGWSKLATTTGHHYLLGSSAGICGIRHTSGGTSMFLYWADAGAGSDVTLTGTAQTDWHHYALNRAANGTVAVYVDGASIAVTRNNSYATAFNRIGTDNSALRRMNGLICGVRYYSENVSQANIQAIIAAQASPVNSAAAVVSGTVAVGYTLTCTPGTWSDGAKTYQWVSATSALGAGKANIAGATSATYKPTAAVLGKYIGCDETSTNAYGAVTQISNYTTTPVIVLGSPFMSHQQLLYPRIG